MEVHFVSLFFLNEVNITSSVFTMHSKWTIVYYASLNSRSICKTFLNYLPLNILFNFFFMLVSTRLVSISKNLCKNYHFLIQIFKIIFKWYTRWLLSVIRFRVLFFKALGRFALEPRFFSEKMKVTFWLKKFEFVDHVFVCWPRVQFSVWSLSIRLWKAS